MLAMEHFLEVTTIKKAGYLDLLFFNYETQSFYLSLNTIGTLTQQVVGSLFIIAGVACP